MKDVYVLELDYDGCHANMYKKPKDEKVTGVRFMKGLIWNKYPETKGLFGKVFVDEDAYMFNELKYAVDHGTVFNGEMYAIYNELGVEGAKQREHSDWVNRKWSTLEWIEKHLDFSNKKTIKDIVERLYGTDTLDRHYRDK